MMSSTYKQSKFGRKRDQRSELLKGLADSFFLHESISTTLPKAKVLKSYSEKLITKSKAGGLHNRRQVIRSLQTTQAANKLFDDIAPKLSSRQSGYLRIEKTVVRRGDNTQMARLVFVDNLTNIKPTDKKHKPRKTLSKSAPKSAAVSSRKKAAKRVAKK